MILYLIVLAYVPLSELHTLLCDHLDVSTGPPEEYEVRPARDSAHVQRAYLMMLEPTDWSPDCFCVSVYPRTGGCRSAAKYQFRINGWVVTEGTWINQSIILRNIPLSTDVPYGNRRSALVDGMLATNVLNGRAWTTKTCWQITSHPPSNSKSNGLQLFCAKPFRLHHWLWPGLYRHLSRS